MSQVVHAQVERDGALDVEEVCSVVSALLVGGINSIGQALGTSCCC